MAQSILSVIFSTLKRQELISRQVKYIQKSLPLLLTYSIQRIVRIDKNFTMATDDYTTIKEVSKAKCFEGQQNVYQHQSAVLGCSMKFAVYLPSAVESKKLPVLYYLSGLTCTEQNVITKSGFQRYAQEYNLIVVAPDTSPRDVDVAGQDASWDIGTGAGFYVDATQPGWNKHYKMYSYVTKELLEVVAKNFPVDPSRVGITGHSMGGHGALISFFKNPTVYKSVSAFAPISNPIESAWGKKALSTYIGENVDDWKQYDATELVQKQARKDATILIDQGGKDEWTGHLVPDNFPAMCKKVGQPVEYNLRGGYDHGYFFVSTFIQNHFAHHAKVLHS